MESLAVDNMTGEYHYTAETTTKYLTATTIIGNKIYNNLNKKLGEIKDIMLNVQDGTIEYVVIEFGRFLGMGEKYLAVPFRALALHHSRHAFVLGQEKGVLENAPGFDKNHLPETNSAEMRPTSENCVKALEPAPEE